MLSKENNDLVTLTGAGMPGGELLRRYWQPVALSAELKSDVPLAVRVMSEDLVLYRDARGKPGLLGRRCPHRGVDLSYGRVEDGGLRCLYHGWLMGTDGRCLDQPGEPEGSLYRDRIQHKAYPWANDKGAQDFIAWVKQYDTAVDVRDSFAASGGYMVGQLTVQILKAAGNDLTRENILKQATNLHDVVLPMLIPGITINTSPNDYRSIKQLQFEYFDGQNFVLTGDIISD